MDKDTERFVMRQAVQLVRFTVDSYRHAVNKSHIDLKEKQRAYIEGMSLIMMRLMHVMDSPNQEHLWDKLVDECAYLLFFVGRTGALKREAMGLAQNINWAKEEDGQG